MTLSDVAAAARVSPATVSRVLNNNYPVAATTRQRVEEAVRELDYVVNAHARALLHARSGIVGVILNDITDPFFSAIARGVQSAAAELGHLIIIADSEGNPEHEFAYIDMLRRQRAEAIVVTGAAPIDSTYRRRAAALAKAIQAQGSRLVLCLRPPPTRSVKAQVVTVDDVSGSRALVEHLTGLGHTRIAYVTGPPGRTTSNDRLRGFREAMRGAGLAMSDELVERGDFSRASGYEATKRLLGKRTVFSALCAANDLMATGVLAALREAGVAVPEQVSVAGFDDVAVASDVHPQLTTVRVPLEEAGRQAVNLAFADGTTGASTVLSLELIFRESTKAPPA